MKAIVIEEFGGPEVLRLKDMPDPTPGSDDVLIKTRAVGVNPVDAYIRAGTYARKPLLPYTPGSDSAGIVQAVGLGVKKFRPGDRVYTSSTISGAYAQLVLCHEAGVHRLPDSASFSQGAALGVPFATAYRGLFQKAHASVGETVLIHGATGGVGHAAVQWARAAGLNVIGTAGSEEGKKFVQKNGAHHVLNHAQDDQIQRIQEITNSRGVDIIIELLANVNLDLDLKVIARHARVVVIGSRGTIQINPRDLMGTDSTVFGMTLFNATSEELEEIHRAIIDGLEKKILAPVIGTELRLEQAAKAHEMIMNPGKHGKIILLL